MTLILFSIWMALIIAVTIWAAKWGRSAIGYFLLSFFLSPIIAAVFLLALGKKGAQASQEVPPVRTDG